MPTQLKGNFICILFLLAFTSKAQDTIYNKKLGLVVKTDILPTALSIPVFEGYFCSLAVEKFIGKKQSFQLSGNLYYLNDNSFSHTTSYRSFRIIPEYRFYLNKKAWHKRMYCGIYSGFIDQHEFIPNKIYDHRSRSVSIGGVGGYQIYLFKHFAVDFLFGLGATKNIYSKYITYDGLHPHQRLYYFDGRLSLNIGYVFY